MDNNEVVVAEEVAAVAENNTGIEIEPLFEEQVDFDTFSKSDFRVVKVKNCEAVPKSKKTSEICIRRWKRRRSCHLKWYPRLL